MAVAESAVPVASVSCMTKTDDTKVTDIMRKRVLFLFIGMLHVPAAFAQFRADQPPVLTAPRPAAFDDGEAVIKAFRARYKTAREPKLALFWNRELTDHIAQRTAQRSSTQSSKSESVASASGMTEGRTEKLEQASATTVNVTETIDDNTHAALDSRSDALLKTAFVSVLQRGGTHIVDRALMVRSEASNAATGTDAQANEMRGLQGRAGWLLEVLLVPDQRAPLGHGFKVSVKDIAQGTLITEIYTLALPPVRNTGGMVPVNGVGFMRAPPAAPSVGDVGHTLGVELLARLSQIL